jgi:integrase
MTMLTRRRLAIASEAQPVFPDSLGGWRDPSNVRRVWRQVRDDAAVPTRKISDQLGHSQVSMTQNRYLGRKLTDRQTADVLEKLLGSSGA